MTKKSQKKTLSLHAELTRTDIRRFDRSIKAIVDSSAVGLVRILSRREIRIMDPFEERRPAEAALLRAFRNALIYSGLTLQEAMDRNGINRIILERRRSDFAGEILFDKDVAKVCIHSRLKDLAEDLVLMEQAAWLKLTQQSAPSEATAEAFQNFMRRLNFQGMGKERLLATLESLDFGRSGGTGHFIAGRMRRAPIWSRPKRQRITLRGATRTFTPFKAKGLVCFIEDAGDAIGRLFRMANPYSFREQLAEIRRQLVKSNWPMLKMSKAQIFAKLRQTREEVWQEAISRKHLPPGSYLAACAKLEGHGAKRQGVDVKPAR